MSKAKQPVASSSDDFLLTSVPESDRAAYYAYREDGGNLSGPSWLRWRQTVEEQIG